MLDFKKLKETSNKDLMKLVLYHRMQIANELESITLIQRELCLRLNVSEQEVNNE